MTMRAWEVQGAGEPDEVLHLTDREPPAPGPGQVRIRVAAAGIGLPDLFMCRGRYPLTPPVPFTPGQEAAGTVLAVGDGVDVAVGDRVMGTTLFMQGDGSFAEECLLYGDSALPIPGALSDAEAAGFWIPHFTAWVGLVDRGGLEQGDQLVVLGASGGSGIAAVQLGKALGARVVAVVSDADRAAFCRDLGADVTVDYHDGPLPAKLREATGGRGADLVFDPVGGELAEEAVKAMARGGRFLAIGFASGRWPQLATHDLVVTNTSLVGVIAGGQSRAELREIHAALTELLDAGRLRTAVTRSVPFDQLPDALGRMAGRGLIGKQVLVP
jgi:NADPH2:quinone reductase